MGEVYLAVDTVLERQVAVKVLAEQHAREPEIRARFEREGLAAARLSRERHVVTVFDVGEHGGRPYIVMEYVEGGSVHDRLAQGRVPQEQALRWLGQVARALDRAHASGVVHRDVKPANLLLDSEGNVRVTDFGIASAAGLEELTLPGTVLGTAGYLAPEQARGEPATAASDRYALGVIAFELLTGTRPFAGDTPATQAFAHVNAPVPQASEFAPALPPEVDAVLARALAKDPSERPGSGSELVAELAGAVAAAPPNVTIAATDAERPGDMLVQAPEPTAHTRVGAPGGERTPQRLYTSRGRAASGVAALAAGAGAWLGGRGAAALDWSRRRPRTTLVGAAATTLLVALLAALLVDVGNEGNARPPERAPAAAPPPAEDAAGEPAVVDGAALNAEGFELMQQGRFADALPILREAVSALRGSGLIDEAYASYNLAYTRFALGRCDGVIGLLDRSERVQGDREEIDELRREWDDLCGPRDGSAADDDDDVDEGRSGRGNGDRGEGKGRGRGRGR